MRNALLVLVSIVLCAPAEAQQVTYRGRAYSSRVCSSPNCAMCNRIEAGLAAQSYSPGCTGPNCQLQALASTAYASRVFSPLPTLQAIATPPAVSVASTRLADTALEPSPQWAVDAMLDIAAPRPGMTLVDMGCGDGRILVTAASRYGARAIGVELNPTSVALARANATAAGVSDLVTVVPGDVRKIDLPADIVTMYLFPELIDAVWPKIEPGTLVVSYSHPLPASYARKVERVIEGKPAVFFVGVKQKR